MRLYVGKFKGKTLEEVPSSYLKFIAENWNEDTGHDRELCAAADREWTFRDNNNSHFELENDKRIKSMPVLDDVLPPDVVKKLAQMALKWCEKKEVPKTAYNICSALNELGRLIN